jgi:fumarate hydratase class II
LVWVAEFGVFDGSSRTPRARARLAGGGRTGHSDAMRSPAPPTRTEHDSLGAIEVPCSALWGAQTQRALVNFPVSGQPLPPELLVALAQVKQAAAQVNQELGVVPAPIATAIAAAAAAVAAGDHADQFPVDLYQTGSGTSSNMNLNEVLAHLASAALGQPVHPNDHVNASQSSNDVFPTAIHLALITSCRAALGPALEHLATTLAARAADLADVVKAGRTHLMDATPVTVGQELAGHAAQMRRGHARVWSALPAVAEVPLGGTAVGTGVGTPPGWRARVVAELAALTGQPLTVAGDAFEAHAARDGLVEMSGQLRVVAVSLTKICNDLRWMGSGPGAGLGELNLPALQPGSSIMPGKVNPVVPEAVLQVCARVIGNDATVAWAGAAGAFELNTMMPVLGACVLESARLLATACRLLADRCVAGLTANADHARALAERSPAIATGLVPWLGYAQVATVVQQALAERRSIRDVVVRAGHVAAGTLTLAELDRALDVDQLAGRPRR